MRGSVRYLAFFTSLRLRLTLKREAGANAMADDYTSVADCDQDRSGAVKE